MYHAPVRIKRETVRIDHSKMHWVEKVNYNILFATESQNGQVRDDIQNFIKNNLKRYEEITYKMRNKAFEIEEKGFIFDLFSIR